MSMAEHKVSELKNYDVYEDIMAFLDEFDQKNNDKRKNREGNTSKSNTRLVYESSIYQFFKILLNKAIEYLTEDDLKSIKKRDVINYRRQLQEIGNSNKTINKKMAAVRSCFTFLNGEHQVNTSIFELKRLDEESNPYGILNQTEAEKFAQMAFVTEKHKGYMKKMLILIAIRTSFRIDELLNLKWNSFENVDGVWKVSVVGKRGKLVTNAITDNMYNQLLKLKELNKQEKWDGDPEIIFQISERAVNAMMARLKKRLNISPDRHIVFHSFRNVGINWELENSHDIKAAAQQGNHSNIETTWKNYIDKHRDYTLAAGVRMDEQIDLSFLDELTLDDFKNFIKQGDYKLQRELMNYWNNKKDN